MDYYIYPEGSPSHTSVLEAIDLPSGKTIQWRQNGSVVKSGSTDDPGMQRINTQETGDFRFYAKDTGSIIDFFVVEDSEFSNPVELSNNIPVLVSATVVKDSYGISATRPSFIWDYSDQDHDPQFLYRVRIGTSPGSSDLLDTGFVSANDQFYAVPSTVAAIAEGSTFYWQIDVSDGEKTNPIDPDSTTDRVLVSKSGNGIANNRPAVSDVMIDGYNDVPEVPDFNPVISWTYADADSQPQQSFTVVLSSDSLFSNVYWSYTGTGTQNYVTYNLDKKGRSLASHVAYYVKVTAKDTYDYSDPATEGFSIAHRPVITGVLVNGKINPTNLKDQNPTFRWGVYDADSDPITGYEIRVGTDSADWGTDSFVGEIWHPGFITTREAFQTRMTLQAGAFGGCIFPKEIRPNVTYYFQVIVRNGISQPAYSEWFTGYFKLNNAPKAENLRIVPSPAYNNDDLEAVYDFVDDVGEAEDEEKTVVKWYKSVDGGLTYGEQTSLVNQKVIPHTETKPFEMWKFTVCPHDGTEYGETYTSLPVTIANRAPSVVSLSINPQNPRAGDSLEAVFSVSDPDGDAVSVSIKWYKNGTEQQALANKRIVPPFLLKVDDVWRFTVVPTDGYTSGQLAASKEVVVANTRPEIRAIRIDGTVAPGRLGNSNPTFSWLYFDADFQSQGAYQLVIGTKLLKTRSVDAANSSGAPPVSFICSDRQDGIVSVAEGGEVISGNEVFDSGVIQSPNTSHKYATEDHLPSFSVLAADAVQMVGYRLSSDAKTMELSGTTGTTRFGFPGLPGTYEAEILYLEQEAKRSRYEILVDDVKVDEFPSNGTKGSFRHKFKASSFASKSKVVVRGTALTEGSLAAFISVSFSPIKDFEVPADQFSVLSGYVSDGSGGIKLASLAGSATLEFPFPSGQYDVDLAYVTESSGNPSVSVSVNNVIVDSFTFESGVRTRTRTIYGVSLHTGDRFKINGARGRAASARIKKLTFKPKQTLQTGTKFKDGLSYYASVRAYDGKEWSRWYTTRFTMAGSAWVSSVSNRKGWTIEARFALLQSSQASGTSGFSGSSSASASSQTIGFSSASGASGQSACENDTFQGIRAYDGTYLGWLRLKPDKVELLAGENLEYAVDGTQMHTYRLSVVGQDAMLYVDNELAIDGTGKFNQPTSKRMVEFGDIAGREQVNGSVWESFRYSTDGAYGPNALVDYDLDEVQRFANSSIGRLKTYKDKLYVSVDPDNPDESSRVYRYEEGFASEPRSVIPLNKASTTCLVVDPNRKNNIFGTSGKVFGSNRGLQYMLGSKPFPFDGSTLMSVYPEDNGWNLETNCSGSCYWLSGDGTLAIDTTKEDGESYVKFTHRKKGELWVDKADNAKGWTVEVKVMVTEDGNGGLVDKSTTFVLGANDQCNPALGVSVTDYKPTSVPEDDGLNAPGIVINDGRFQEIVQFFASGIRLKYAQVFGERKLSDQFCTVRIIGKDTSIAVYVKGDNDRFFKRVIFSPNGLYVRTQTSGNQEKPQLVVDQSGSVHVVYQDSLEGSWVIKHTKTSPQEIVAKGSSLYSSSFVNFDKFVAARTGFGLPADRIDRSQLDGKTLFSGGASFISWGVKTGDVIIVFSKANTAVSYRKFVISSVTHETTLKVETDEDLSGTYNGFEYVIARGIETWLEPTQLSSEMLDSNNPKIALAPNNEVLVAYQNTENGNSEIYVRTASFDPFVVSWKRTVRLTNARYDSVNPDLTLRPSSNNVVIVWQDSRDNRSGSRIYASEILPQDFGVLESYVNKDITPSATAAKNPKIAALGEKVFVVYEDDPERDGSSDIYLVELNDRLESSDPAKISSVGNCTNPCITTVVGSTETLAVAWQSEVNGISEIYAARGENALADDFHFGEPVRVTSSRGQSVNPDVRSDPYGNVFVCFQDDRNRGGFPDIYVSRYDAKLAEWISSYHDGLDVRVENYVTSSSRPSLGIDKFGSLALAWEAEREGETRIAKTSFNTLPTMDSTVAAYFPLDVSSAGPNEVVNKIRQVTGTPAPAMEVCFVINKSQNMSGNRLADAKTVANALISSLQEGDLFTVLAYDLGFHFYGAYLEANSVNKAAAIASVSALSAGGCENFNIGVISGTQPFSNKNTTKITVLLDFGHPNCGVQDEAQIRDNISGQNSLNIKIISFGVSGANKSLLDGVCADSGGSAKYRDDYQTLDSALDDFYALFNSTRNSARSFDFTYEEAKNGTAFDDVGSYQCNPINDLSLANPDTQRGFNLADNGKGFSTDISLLSTSGAVDLWMVPHWPSEDITDRVIFGNAEPGTTTKNTMVCGVRPAGSGNDLYFRIVDSSGVERETFINNPDGGPKAFDWQAEQAVNLRFIWDQNIVGTSTVRGICFPTSSVGYACAQDGSMFKTTDGGATWARQATGLTYELYSVDFVDENVGWACGEMGTVLRTLDGGENWAIVDTDHENDLNGICFRTVSIGYAVGSGGLILRSEDGGNTWDEVSVSANTDFSDVGLLSDGSNTVVAAVGSSMESLPGGDRNVYLSTDDGLSYASSELTGEWKAISRTHQAGSYASYLVGPRGAIVSTDDLGATWNDLGFDWGLGYSPNLYGVSHGPNSDYAYVVGQNGSLARTSDGSAFERVSTGVYDGILRAVAATGNQPIVAAGVGGTVVVSSDAGSTQNYYTTRCGNMRILVNGIEPRQTRIHDGPFEWDPASGPSGLVFGDYTQGGTHTVGAVLDEIIIYSAPPPWSGSPRRKDFWIHQGSSTDLLLEALSKKRLEWGSVSPLVKTTSYWKKVELFLCGAKEPTQVFGWDSQIGLVDDMVRCMALDHSNRLWVGTENGISSVDLASVNEDIERWLSGRPLLPVSKDRIVNYTNLANGLVADSISAIAVDSNNDIWAGTSKGLMYLKTNRSSAASGGTDPVDQGSISEEIVNAPAQKFETYTTQQGLPSDNVLSLRAVGDAMFVGTDAGLAVITPNQASTATGTATSPTSISVETYDESSGLPSARVQAIAQEKVSGTIWIGTDMGLARFSKEETIVFDASTDMPNTDISSITVDNRDRKYVGTGFGITRIDGADARNFQPSEGIGFGGIMEGSADGSNVKWFATSEGLLELDEACGDRVAKYGLDDGILGNPSIPDYKYYRILGGEVPSGGCNKALVNVAVNGVQRSGGFVVDEFVPWIVFDRPLISSDRVSACLDKGWRKAHDFNSNPSNPSGLATLETSLSTFYLYRKKYSAGTVILGANFSPGASNDSTAMYSVLALPVIGDQPAISSVQSPSGTRLDASIEKGETSLYSDEDDAMQVIPAEFVGAQHVALPSADASLVDDEYLELTLSLDAVLYVAYDSRSGSLPGWLRSFQPMRSVSRVTDMETFTDGTEKEKLFMSVRGTTGCVYDLLNDPEICDISDNIAVDGTPPEGCAKITRLNSLEEAVLSLNASDPVTGVSDMQVSAYENFTTDGETPIGWVPYQQNYNLQIPVEVMDPIEELDETVPTEEDPQSPEQFPDIEYTTAYQHLDDVLLGTRTPGRVYVFNKTTQKVSFLFDTGEEEVLSMVSFGEDLVVGTGTNGAAFRWDGHNLTHILLPTAEERVAALAVFDNRVFFGTSPNGIIYQMDQFGTVQLFMDTNETSVNAFAVSGGQLFWATSNDEVHEGDDLGLTTRMGHRHSIIVPVGVTRISGVNGQTTEVEAHVHQVVNGVVQVADGHDHQLNGSRSGKIFRLDLASGLSSIVHADKDYSITAMASNSISGQGLMFAGTFPNGKVLRYVPEETIFIKSFDTAADSINSLRVIDSVFYAVAGDDLFFFDGKRWQFFASVADEILDMIGIGKDLLVVRKKSLGRTSQTTGSGQVPSADRTVCAYVRFRDAAGNMTSVRDSEAKLIECYNPCITVTSGGGDGGGGGGRTDNNPLLKGSHRIVEVDGNGRVVFSLGGPDPFLSGNRVEEEVGRYYSEVFNGTNSLVQWTSLSWTGTVQQGSSITIAARTSSTRSGINSAEFGPEFTAPEGNDLTNLVGQFLQFRVTLRVSEEGVPSPQLDKVDIGLRISEATHYFTTNFSLPDDLQKGILTYTGCRNPPATDIVFGISGKDSTDFSDYFVITPRKLFEVPAEHQTQNLRVGIKLISSPDTVSVVDEFALLFSLANDAIVRLNLPGQPTEIVVPPPPGPTRTVITEKVQGHVHSITFDSSITDKAGINGQTSISGGHSHLVVNGAVQVAAGHVHEFSV
jgi:photosystem II stability/assembly factor-like uncharacterized protein